MTGPNMIIPKYPAEILGELQKAKNVLGITSNILSTHVYNPTKNNKTKVQLNFFMM